MVTRTFRFPLFAVLLLFAVPLLWGHASGKLQLHFIDVGQSDGAILISPGGQVAAFDIGQDMVGKDCEKPVAYYDQLATSWRKNVFA
jgi:beta-lactamase superfamily II metal-dependent hydrolase